MAKKETGKAVKDVAFQLFDEGKRPSDPEVKALGLKSKTRYNYFQLWKKLGAAIPEISGGSPGEPHKVVGRAIEVGKITITPENWGMSQYGAILILDTYNKAKADIGYSGTMGEFLCDICEFYRRILNYKEVEYVRATGEGGRGAEEDGRESVGHTEQPAQS